MISPQELAQPLASAFAAGTLTAEGLLERGRCVVGKRRWLRGLVERLLVAFGPQRRVLQRQLQTFLVADRLFQRACQRWDEERPLGLPPRPHHEPPEPLRDLGLPAWENEAALAAWLGVSLGELAWFADPHHLQRTHLPKPLRHYRGRWIRKRGGTARLIESPKPRLKAMQRRLLHELLDAIPQHAAAHGFRRGRSILSCAAPHAGREVVVRMDLSDFFPSIVAARVNGIFLTLGYPEPVAQCLTGLCTTWTPQHTLDQFPLPHAYVERMRAESLYRQPHLPQGAPTSPALANLCAYRLDARLAGLAAATDATYTRYADDLIFSGDGDLARSARRFIVHVGAIALDENFSVNFRKTRVMRRGVRQRAAGLIVNQHPNVPRDEFDRLKAILHNCLQTGPAAQNRTRVRDFRAHLAGKIAFVRQVNPARGDNLQKTFERIQW